MCCSNSSSSASFSRASMMNWCLARFCRVQSRWPSRCGTGGAVPLSSRRSCGLASLGGFPTLRRTAAHRRGDAAEPRESMTYVDAALAPLRKTGQIKLYGPAAFEGMRRAGRLVAECLDMLTDEVQPGVATERIDRLV